MNQDRTAFLSVVPQPGADGALFAEMLLNMYAGWAARRGFPAEVQVRARPMTGGVREGWIVIELPSDPWVLRGECIRHIITWPSPSSWADHRVTNTSVSVLSDIGMTEETRRLYLPAEGIVRQEGVSAPYTAVLSGDLDPFIDWEVS